MHELYHYILESEELEMSWRKEEQEARIFPKEIMKKR